MELSARDLQGRFWNHFPFLDKRPDSARYFGQIDWNRHTNDKPFYLKFQK